MWLVGVAREQSGTCEFDPWCRERALQRRFAQDVGYGPKVLQRVLRFQRFMRELAAPRVELARAGLLAGYADQSHLSRETRRLAGLSPRQLKDWYH